jgi:hypothetical protein
LAKVREYVCIELPWPVGVAVEVALEAIVLAGEGRSVADGEDVPLAVAVELAVAVPLAVQLAVPIPDPVSVGVPVARGLYTDELGFPE